MVRKRNMNKKRSQVAHYVKCELLVARRDPWRFFCSCCCCCVSRSSLSFIACVRCLVVSLSISFVSLYMMSLWNMCIVCIILYILCIFEIPPPNGVLFVLLGFRSFNCSVCSSFFISLFSLVFGCCVCCAFFCRFSVFFFYFYFIPFRIVIICNRERIYVARTSSHRYKWNAFRCVWDFTFYSTHAISMD